MRLPITSSIHSFFSRAAAVALVMAGVLFAFTAEASAAFTFKRTPTQYIAALGDADATRGTGAELWGLWALDPGPRGVHLTESAAFLSKGVAPAGWAFDAKEWWMEEYGRIMEKPVFPLPPSSKAGRYVVTNGSSTMAVLTVHEKDAAGHMAWELSEGATLISVTHLGCRAGRYQPETAGAACTPANAMPHQFPVPPGAAMPSVVHCAKQDYHVLIVIGMVDEGA